jgi:hypothetical protein
MLGLVGVIAKDTSVAGFTVRVVDPDMLPDVAVMVLVPAATEVARPFEPVVLLIDATLVLEEFQATVSVRSCVELSENVPVAVNCWVVPLAMLGLAGVIARATSDAAVTVRSVEPEVSPDVAVIFVFPAFFPYAYACLPVFDGAAVESGATLVIVATLVSDELQVTDAVRSCVVLSE